MSLFREIANGGEAASTDLHEEVRAHLLRLCRIRRGSLLLAPAYGSDDPAQLFHSFPGGLEVWRANLEAAIGTYERRLRAVRVSPKVGESRDLVLRFDIDAILVTSSSRGPLHFQASVDPSRGWAMV